MQIEQQLETLHADEPERDYAVSVCVEAWHDLSTCRGIGMAMGPIPWTAAAQWCDWRGLDRDASMILMYVLRQLDNDRAEAEAATRRLEEAAGRRGQA